MTLPDITAAALAFVEAYGLVALALFAFAESSMTFPFLPSEVVLPFAAALLVTGPVSFALFVAAATLGGTVGCLVAFAAAAAASDEAAALLSRYVRLDPDDLSTGQRWFRRYGQSTVLWGRFLPVLRSVVSVPAGAAGMDPRRFTLYSAVGSGAFYAATAALVHWGRQHAPVDAAVDIVADAVPADPAALMAAALLALVLAGAGYWLLDRRERAGN